MSRRLTALVLLVISAVISLPLPAFAEIPYDTVWTRQMGSEPVDPGGIPGVMGSEDAACGVAVDSSGNVYITGGTQGALDCNTSAGDADIFLAKYDPAGVRQWTRQMGTVGNDYAQGVSVDGSGSVYVAGFTEGGLDGNTNAGIYDLFVVKYDGAGVKQWTRQMGTSDADNACDISVDGLGNVYVAGYTGGGLDGNTNAYTLPPFSTGWDFMSKLDLFLVMYNADGVKQWTRQMGTTKGDMANGVSADGTGNVYVAGYTYGGLDGNTNAGDSDIIVVKYDTDGVKQWTRQMGTASGDFANGVSVDSSGNVYVAGVTYGGLDGNTNAGDGDIVVVKYDMDGVKQWTRQMGTSEWDEATGVSVDGSGNIYVAGFTYGGLDGNTNSGSGDLFVIKYDPAGIKLWTRQTGATADDRALDVSVDGSGNMYVAGGVLTAWYSVGDLWAIFSDILLAKLAPLPVISDISYPLPLYSIIQSGNIPITGTAEDRTGSGLLVVDISTDGGSTWNPAYDTSGVGDWTTWGYDWLIPEVGTYNLVSRATSNNTAVEPVRDGVTVTVVPPPLTLNSLTPSINSPAAAGSTVNWTGVASGGSYNFEYRFWVFDTAWHMLRNWSASDTYVWTPVNYGPFKVLCNVREVGQTAPQSSITVPYVITAPPMDPISLESLTALPLSGPVTPGTTVTWTGTASGGTGSYQYRFWVYDTAWHMVRNWLPVNTYDWTPTLAGKYIIQCQVRNAGTNVSNDDYIKSPPYVVAISYQPAVLDSLTPVAPGTATVGAPYVLTGTASSGSGSYEFRFWLKDKAVGTWGIARNWSPANTYNWTPAAPGQYQVICQVRNSGNTTAIDGSIKSGWYIVP